MTSGDQIAGRGAGEVAIGVAPVVVLDPAAAARDRLFRSAEGLLTYLPGAATADWANWPKDPGKRALVPPAVRVGTFSSDAIPMVLPVDGEFQYAVGHGELVTPVIPKSVKVAEKTITADQVEHLKSKAKADAVQGEKNRLAWLGHERELAIGLVKGVATRSFNSTLPGSMSLEVCGSAPTLRAMSDFSPLSDRGLYVPTSLANLRTFLSDIAADMAYRNGTLLSRATPTLRSLVAKSGHPAPQPFKMIAIFGDGMPIQDQQVASLLTEVLSQGHEVGYTFFVHGIQLPERVQRLAFTEDRQKVVRVDSPVFGGLRPRYDGPPPDELVWNVSGWTVEEIAEGVDPYGGDFYVEAGPSGQNVIDTVTHGFQRMREATEAHKTHNEIFPWLQPDALRIIDDSSAHYDQLVNTLAYRDSSAISRAKREIKREEDVHPSRQLATWAATALAESTLGHGQNWQTSVLYGGVGTLYTNHQRHMASVVGITSRHMDPLNTHMRPYLERSLHATPPAWAFQLLADRIIHDNWREYSGGASRAAIDALAFDIEQTYRVRLRTERQVTDTRVANCLAACRLLDLHGFRTRLAPDYQPRPALEGETLPEPDRERNQARRVTLARYVERQLLQLNREQLMAVAPAALRTYDACYALLNELGFTPTARERAVAAGKAALDGAVGTGKRLGALAARLRSPGEETAEGGDGTQPAGEPGPDSRKPDKR